MFGVKEIVLPSIENGDEIEIEIDFENEQQRLEAEHSLNQLYTKLMLFKQIGQYTY